MTHAYGPPGQPGRLRTRAGAALALVAVLGLTGCQSVVTSTVVVEDETRATLTAEVTFREEAADAVLGDASLDKQVRDVLAKRTGAEVEREGQPEDESVTYSVAVPYDKLADVSGIVGVSSATLDATGQDEVTVKVAVVDPDELVEAITQGTAGEADSEAVKAVVLETTEVNVAVVLPGAISSAVGPGTLKRDSNEVTFTQRLSAFEPGEVVVVGSSKAPLVTPVRLALAGGVLALVGLVVGVAVHRRRRYDELGEEGASGYDGRDDDEDGAESDGPNRVG